MRSRVTEAKSLVTQVVTLQPLYKLKYAGICIDDVNIMYHRQSPKAELFSATTMATDHLLPFHLYFRRRENVVALHILASISRGMNTFFLCKTIANRFFRVRFMLLRSTSIISRMPFSPLHNSLGVISRFLLRDSRDYNT